MSPVKFGVGSGWHPHGPVAFRTDDRGQLVAILPRTCHRGLHVLTEGGYSTREMPQGQNHSGPYVKIECTQCGLDQVADYTWNLTTGGQRPDAVEFDDARYADLR